MQDTYIVPGLYISDSHHTIQGLNLGVYRLHMFNSDWFMIKVSGIELSTVGVRQALVR